MRGGDREGAGVSGHACAGGNLSHAAQGEDGMNCEESKLLLADYWAKTLSETKELEFDAHIATCNACHADAERLGALWSSLAKIPVEEPSPALRSRFYDTLAAFRHGLESAPKPSLKDRILALWPK